MMILLYHLTSLILYHLLLLMFVPSVSNIGLLSITFDVFMYGLLPRTSPRGSGSKWTISYRNGLASVSEGSFSECPQCKALCSLKDVRTLNATCLCIPAADKGVVDPEISTRRFPFSKQGMVKFRKFEIGRRNFALKKRSDAKKRLAGVVGWKNDLMKCRTDLLDRRASVLNLAKALEQRGGSLCRVDALRLRADALGRWADEYLRRPKACEGRVKALSERARAYNQRVKTFELVVYPHGHPCSYGAGSLAPPKLAYERDHDIEAEPSDAELELIGCLAEFDAHIVQKNHEKISDSSLICDLMLSVKWDYLAKHRIWKDLNPILTTDKHGLQLSTIECKLKVNF
ncbi:hypothetical protein Tco_0540869 [Tanacetum coccineum]